MVTERRKNFYHNSKQIDATQLLEKVVTHNEMYVANNTKVYNTMLIRQIRQAETNKNLKKQKISQSVNARIDYRMSSPDCDN